MSQHNYYSNDSIDKRMTAEQFDQVVDAIVTGKYSWACVLMLRFAGYNPLHYIPYRTYSRLIKEQARGQISDSQLSKDKTPLYLEPDRKSTQKGCLNQLSDLAHLEVVRDQPNQPKGGHARWSFSGLSVKESASALYSKIIQFIP